MKIKPKTLELISRDMGSRFTGYALMRFLMENGIPRSSIVYPNTKWTTVYSILLGLSQSENESDHSLLLKIVTSSCHPLICDGDEFLAREKIQLYNSWLKYDDLELIMTTDGVVYSSKISSKVMTNDEIKSVDKDISDTIQDIKKFNSNDLIVLQKSYQILINIVEIFFEQKFKPDEKLNTWYMRLNKIARESSAKIFGSITRDIPMIIPANKYYSPFSNLFGAESQHDGLSQESQNKILRNMKGYYGEITELCFDCSTSDILAESELQKLFNDISLYLSEIKEQNPKAQLNVSHQNNGSPSLPWPNSYHWDENNEHFIVADNKGLEFATADSDRKKIFKSLTEKGGEWVEIKRVLPELKNKDENTFRSVIGALKGKIAVQKLSKYISIEGRGDINKESAYRVYVPSDDVI